MDPMEEHFDHTCDYECADPEQGASGKWQWHGWHWRWKCQRFQKWVDYVRSQCPNCCGIREAAVPNSRQLLRRVSSVPAEGSGVPPLLKCPKCWPLTPRSTIADGGSMLLNVRHKWCNDGCCRLILHNLRGNNGGEEEARIGARHVRPGDPGSQHNHREFSFHWKDSNRAKQLKRGFFPFKSLRCCCFSWQTTFFMEQTPKGKYLSWCWKYQGLFCREQQQQQAKFARTSSRSGRH